MRIGKWDAEYILMKKNAINVIPLNILIKMEIVIIILALILQYKYLSVRFTVKMVYAANALINTI